MKHLISIWIIENGEEVCIKTFYDLTIDPFKIGMVFWLELEEYYPVERNDMLLGGWSEVMLEKYLTEWEAKRVKFNNKNVKIIDSNSSLSLKKAGFRTDYYIEIIPVK